MTGPGRWGRIVYGGGCAAMLPALLWLGSDHLFVLFAAISFWLMVVLAVAGSALSAFCIAKPVSRPKQDPYSFLGQWFLWLVTPMLWGMVAASAAFPWLRPLDLAVVLVAAGLCRWCAQTMCCWKWRILVRGYPAFLVSGEGRTIQLGN